MITSIRELVLYLSHVMKVENIIQATVSVCGQRSFMNGFDCILIGVKFFIVFICMLWDIYFFLEG